MRIYATCIYLFLYLPIGIIVLFSFNAGRHAAFAEAADHGDAGDRDGPAMDLCTASAVGHDQDTLVVQVLASRHAGRSLENPRQVPAYRYSEKYGPLPPCFARATVLPSALGDAFADALLIGGTASVLGEASVHVGRLDAQIDETCRNIAALIGAATGRSAPGTPSPTETAQRLASVRQLRVYVVEPGDFDHVETTLRQRFTGLERMELIRAEICRADLLVEIEGLTAPGVAKLNGSARGARQAAPADRVRLAEPTASLASPPLTPSHR